MPTIFLSCTQKAGINLVEVEAPEEQKRQRLILQAHERNFLTGMNQIVNQYEKEANAKLVRLKRTEGLLAILTILILGLEVWWVFRPTYVELKGQRDQFAFLNHQFKLTQKKAKEAEKMKENFFSVVTHELRTPVNAIVGVSKLLEENQPREDQAENIHVLNSASNLLLALVNDLLDLSKMEAGAMKFETIPFDLPQLMEELEQIFKHRAREKGLYLHFLTGTIVPRYLKGDPVRLRQILTNLINNALKFTQDGGVSVTVQVKESSETNARLVFSVKDTGIGIPQEKQALIFEAFSQADNSTSRKFGGTGLGLAITRQLVQQQEGKIWVQSEEGKGACFTFVLEFPLATTEELRKDMGIKSLKDIPQETLKGLRVLIAEDDTMNQFVIRKLMSKWDINFDIAENGREVLEHLLQEKPYDLILMDFDMPVMDGMQATRHIRAIKDPYYQQIPIIAITASSMEVVKETLEATGMNDYIPKPFYSEDLARIILKYVG